MTRWLLLFFVLVMPIQFAWSASAVYCEHENTPTPFHLGHHVHVHKDADAQGAPGPDDTAGSAAPMAHPDCSYCHASVAQLPVGLLSLLEAPYGNSVQHPPRLLYAFRIDPDIDRPKWMRAS